MVHELPIGELTVAISRIHGLLLTQEKVDDAVHLLARAPTSTGQGPCLTAWAAEETVLVDDLAAELRWPEWRTTVTHLPIRSVVSAPLIAGKECIGAVKVYAALPHAYDSSSEKLLELFAGPAATLLSHIQASEAPIA